MGERNGPDAGETTLAAATAAIITARWTSRPGSAQGAAHGPENGYSNGHATNGNGGFTEFAPPATGLGEPTFDGLPPISPAPGVASAPPVSPAPFATPPVSPAPFAASVAPSSPGPYGQSAGPTAASYFSAVAPDPVPEVFASPPAASLPSASLPSASLPARDAARDLAAPREDVRTQVPPGFERRTFGPFPEPTEQPPAASGWALPDTRGATRTEEPRESVPSALLGVLPPPVTPHPMPATFAPPEPAPWTDSGWVDFPRDIEPDSSTVAGGGGRTPLPKRTPRVPELDYPLFDHDPAEPAPDPVTERLELNRIADFLRDEEPPAGTARMDAIDFEAVLGAVREVPDVKDAQLRWTPTGQALRIEFADGVDETEVTRSVVRLLRAKLGLAAQPSPEEPTVDSPFRGRAATVRSLRSGARVAAGRPLPRPSTGDAPRLVVENVSVTRLGPEATVEVRLRQPHTGATVVGEGRGPGVDAYLSRLAATAAAHAVDKALTGWGAPRGKVFIEHVSVVPFGVIEVAVVVLLLAYDDVTEQLSGSAIVGDDPHVTVVRATLAALNRRLESLLG